MSEELNGCSVTRLEKDLVTFHVFTSPVEGEGVNSQIVETPNALVLIDVPLLKPYAEAHRAYVEGLGKPIEKILITHAHPDHWFTVSHYQDYPTYAFQEALDEMTVLRELAINYHQSIHGNLMPDEVFLPSDTIEEGTLTVDGVVFNLHKVKDAEATCTMVIEVPVANTLLPQDLIYNQCYPYVATKTVDGESTVDSWIKHLETYRSKGYETIIPGHGVPTNVTVFDEMIAFLKTAKQVLATAQDGDEFISRIKNAYPSYSVDITLIMAAFMLYQPEAG